MKRFYITLLKELFDDGGAEFYKHCAPSGANSDIQIFRVTRLGIFHHRVRADDQIPNLMLVEFF